MTSRAQKTKLATTLHEAQSTPIPIPTQKPIQIDLTINQVKSITIQENINKNHELYENTVREFARTIDILDERMGSTLIQMIQRVMTRARIMHDINHLNTTAEGQKEVKYIFETGIKKFNSERDTQEAVDALEILKKQKK
jgi:hypothetical protein